MADLRCNVCDKLVQTDLVAQHIAERNHAIKKKVAQYNEMNAQIKPSYQNDISPMRAWIRDLHKYDFLTSGTE